MGFSNFFEISEFLVKPVLGCGLAPPSSDESGDFVSTREKVERKGRRSDTKNEALKRRVLEKRRCPLEPTGPNCDICRNPGDTDDNRDAAKQTPEVPDNSHSLILRATYVVQTAARRAGVRGCYPFLALLRGVPRVVPDPAARCARRGSMFLPLCRYPVRLRVPADCGYAARCNVGSWGSRIIVRIINDLRDLHGGPAGRVPARGPAIPDDGTVRKVGDARFRPPLGGRCQPEAGAPRHSRSFVAGAGLRAGGPQALTGQALAGPPGGKLLR